MKKFLTMASIGIMMTACAGGEKGYDATGVFEATEVTVSAEQSGQLIHFAVNEGETMAADSEVGLIDTTQIWLKMQQADATKTVYQSQKPDMEAQVAATRQQLAKARREQQRYEELVSDGASPRKMLDDAESQVQVLEKQLAAQISALNTQLSTLNSQVSTVDVQKSQLQDQLRKCHITASIDGTVLEKYVEQGEFVATGKPLFKMADTKRMMLRAYVTSAQLTDIKVGQKATVYADFGAGERRQYDGVVTWISSRSEFTPKTILTDDERADLVYALKVTIKNDGYVKIGMYGEVSFTPNPSFPN